MLRLAMIFIIKNRWMYIVLIKRCLGVLRLMNVARKALELHHGPRQANTPFQSGKWQSHFANGEWIMGKLSISEKYFAHGEFLRACDSMRCFDDV